jgi:hypothetical protein
MTCFVFSREILGKILYSNTHFKSIEEKEGKKRKKIKKEQKEQKQTLSAPTCTFFFWGGVVYAATTVHA